MINIYDNWKPLRNYLRKLDVNDSLSVIRYYSVRRSGPIIPPVPSDLVPHPWIDKENAFLPWELEMLAREIVISSDTILSPRYTLRNAEDFARAMHKMKAIENYIAEQSIDNGNIRHEISVRLTHKQLPYQTERPNITNMIRYSKIFGHEKVAPILETKTGLKPKQLFTIGIGLWSRFTTLYAMNYPLDNLSLKDITEDDYELFVNLYSKSMTEMKQLLTNTSERKLDDTFFYQYHSLYAYPLILTEIDRKPAHVCPLPTLLYWRITSGLYYDLCKEGGFDNAFGEAFESYVGAFLLKTLENTSGAVFPGEKNSYKSPNRCDWVLSKPSDCLIIECKTKRLTMGAKTSLDDKAELIKQLKILGDAIVQAYLSLNAYRKNSYDQPRFKMPKSSRAYVCITTLEEWYLLGPQLVTLRNIVKIKIASIGLYEGIMTESPFVVMPVSDMEKVAFLAKKHSISEIFQPYIDDSKFEGWGFSSYLHNLFEEELGSYSYVFCDDVEDIFTVPIDLSDHGKLLQTD